MEIDQELYQKLMATFAVEFSEHLETLNKGFLELEDNASTVDRQVLLEELFRAAHSLKGAARAVELLDIEQMAHRLEDVMAAIKTGRLEPDAEKYDVFFGSLDQMRQAMEATMAGKDYPAEMRKEVVARLGQVLTGEPLAPAPRLMPEKPAGPKPVLPAGSPRRSKAAPAPEKPETAQPVRAEAAQTSAPAFGESALEQADTIRVAIQKLDAMMADVGELLVARTHLNTIWIN